MPITQLGNINTTALFVPDVWIQIVPPQALTINGVPTGRLGVVGTASWGPVNQAVIVGDSAQFYRSFGAYSARRYDMGTQVATATQQGAGDLRCVRVTDNTDLAATSILLTALTLTARYTGTRGNLIQAVLTAGSRANTWRLVIAIPGQIAESFDSIPNNASSTVTWNNIMAAVNAGTNVLRGPSQTVVATLAAGVATTIVAGSSLFTGGTDGATGVTAAMMVGNDAPARTGMYALRGQGCGLAVIADLDDSTQWSVLAAFGYSEAIYMIVSGPSNDTISNAVSTKQTAGVDDYSIKTLLGDWIYWSDPVNQVVRIVSPQGFVAGRLANLSPEQSSLNKPIYGIVSTQRLGLPGQSGAQTYSMAELTALGQAGIDVITNPAPSGPIFAARFGHNSSTNPTISGDNYVRLTNYLASTFLASMGLFVGRTVSSELFRQIRSSQLQFLGDLLGQGILGTLDGTLPYNVICDVSNNPPSRTGLGYVQADIQVRYMAILERFIINLEGGQTVVVTRQTLPSGQR